LSDFHCCLFRRSTNDMARRMFRAACKTAR
jgi:hypothetical protein